MTERAAGTFEIDLTPQPLANSEADALLGRLSIDKQFYGDLEGTSQGEMLSARTAVETSAGYVAIEKITGALRGKKGTFVLQHAATMAGDKHQLSITVVPDSGTGELVGLRGEMTVQVEGGHRYVLEYTLSEERNV